MPAFKNHESTTRVKALIVGDSGASKTGQLAALANAGYKLRVFDFDSGLDILGNYLTPAGVENVHYMTLKDDLEQRPTAWKTFRQTLLRGWKDGDADLGLAKDWDGDTVLVVDSLSFAGEAAKHEALSINNKKPGAQLSQQEWGEAIRYVENLLDWLTSEHVKCNVLMTAIPIAVDDDGGASKLYPQVVTKNFSMKVARYFNNVLLLGSKRDGARVLRTVSTNKMELKTSAPDRVEAEMAADYARLFELLRNG